MKKLYTFSIIAFTTLFLLALSGSELQAQAGYISTVAGNGIAGFSGDGGLATLAEVNVATAVAIDDSGNIYMNDYLNNRVRKVFASNSKIVTIAGNGVAGSSGDGGPSTSAELNLPTGVAVDKRYNLYIADDGNNRIRKIDLHTGIITTAAGNGVASFSGDGGAATAAELYGSYGIGVDTSGNFYICDYVNERVRKVTVSNGIINTIAGTGTAGYNGDNIPATSAELNDPNAVSIDDMGNVYIAEVVSNRIRKVDYSTGIITTVAGNGTAGFFGDTGPATAAEINNPYGVTVDPAGSTIFIGDAYNYRIRQVTLLSGIITTMAGTGAPGYNGDGIPATSAELNNPWNMTLDAAGNLYFGDNSNFRVRKINGAVTTGINAVQNSSGVNLFPNPNNGAFSLGIRNKEQGVSKMQVEIYNMLGKKVYSNPFTIYNSQFTIDLSSNPGGVYLYKVMDESGALVGEGKFIIQK